jgi:RNA polymerase sigma factor (sigma-70 family)
VPEGPRAAPPGRKQTLAEATTLTPSRFLPRSRRLLATLGDQRLALEAGRGNEVAFEVIYDRHHRGLLSFCRHMLRSREDAEDALQHTFAAAHRALPNADGPVQLKPWLYTIARNRCLSMLRGRREHAVEEVERSSTVGLSEEVDQWAELRDLLADLEQLPERQKAALVLSEVGDLDHAHVAQVLDCETKQVKSLVFQARSALIENRRAREIPCEEIREQLATASAGELRRGPLRRHLRQCPGCAEFREEIRSQRRMLAIALPVVPSLGLKESALAAAGLGGGGAAGGGGLIAALGASGVAKVATVGVVTTGAAGGLVAADPALVPKAQAAVERAADGVAGAVFGPTLRARPGVDPATSGSLDWDAATRLAGEKRRRETATWPDTPSNAARGAPSRPSDGDGDGEAVPGPPGAPGPRAGGSRGADRSGERGASGSAPGRGPAEPGSRGRDRGRGPRSRGPVDVLARTPARGRAAARRAVRPRLGAGRGSKPPRPGKGRSDKGRPLPKSPRPNPGRGKGPAPKLGAGD